MKELIDKSNYNIRELKTLITRFAAREFDALSEPCYYPRTKLAYHEMLRVMKLTDKDVKEFVKRQYKGTKAEKWVLWQDPATNLLIVIMHLFILHRDLAAFKTTMVYYMFFQYGRLMNKQLKYCDDNIFRYTIDTLTKTHLFVREKTIANSLYYLASEVRKRYMRDIQEWNLDGIIAFVQASRHRISQSVKSFVNNYYIVKDKGESLISQSDSPDEEGNVYQRKAMERGKVRIEDAIKKLTVYKVVDKQALENAKKISKIKASIAESIAGEMINVEYVDNVRMILNLYLKELKDSNELCGSGYEKYLRKLMGLKRSNATVYFKQQVNVLLMRVLKNLRMEKQYGSYTSQTQFIVNVFLASYITLIFRSTMC